MTNQSETKQNEQPQPMTQSKILEDGLALVSGIINKKTIPLNLQEMQDLLNFVVVLQTIIPEMKQFEGKSPEEALELAKKSLQPRG